MDWAAIEPGWWWLAGGAALALVELMVPGVFLVFVAFAAAVTGIFTLLFPDLPLAGQLLSVAAWSVAAVLIGRRWYGGDAIPTADPMLNDRGQRLIGAQVVVTDAIVDGRGRVRVGDGEWPASGPDAPSGARLVVTGLRDGVLVVEPRP